MDPEGLADAELRVGDEKEKGLNMSWGTECTGAFPSTLGSTNTEKEGSRSIGLNPKQKRGVVGVVEQHVQRVGLIQHRLGCGAVGAVCFSGAHRRRR